MILAHCNEGVNDDCEDSNCFTTKLDSPGGTLAREVLSYIGHRRCKRPQMIWFLAVLVRNRVSSFSNFGLYSMAVALYSRIKMLY